MKGFKITVITVLCLVIAFEIGWIIKGRRTSDDDVSAITGVIAQSTTTVKINNESIPAYTISNTSEIFLTDIDLELFGFKCELGDEGYVIANTSGSYSMSSDMFAKELAGDTAHSDTHKLVCGGNTYDCFKTDKVLFMPATALSNSGKEIKSESTNTIYYAFGNDEQIAKTEKVSMDEIARAEGKPVSTENAVAVTTAPNSAEVSLESGTSISGSGGGRIIVLDPGHGKSSGAMSASEKEASGWVQNSSGSWGEWRHYKIGSSTVDCGGSGCNGRVTPNGACWYPIGNGDRSTEPDVNLQNALAAKRYLEQMGYIVRMTRTTNDENPSITKRLSYCYPGNDTSATADAAAFICIHSNAGGGRGTAYIQLEGEYDQRGISSTYVTDSNRLGKLCNDKIVENTSLSDAGVISFEPELIAFCKSPVACGYLEIGFFDSTSDLGILQSESDSIGKSIAEGVDAYCKGF